MYKPIKQLGNINSAFSMVKSVAIVTCVGAFMMTVLIYFLHRNEVHKINQQVYIMAHDQVFQAIASNRDAQLQVEAKNHVRMFHHYFFSFSPDEEYIHKQIKRAFYLADQSAKKAYDNLQEKGFYNQVLAGNVSQEIEMDSLKLQMDSHPYHFTYYGKQKIVRTTSEVLRLLVTQGKLRAVNRSENNPHGFLIEHWETINNQDIKVSKR
ncbi:conjugative transposon protein TraK [Belliella sp. DSM 111904]|uniref:Conjugative transposon protein TraK n=1 Tax=Belliella filtrata TaxID=2923435 RepID=A0ABS9UZ23_9BACT|nr:conjugative transposon protein TraK [Belliella filtrata]MCH7408985.1 conjugative transposon protein TraK [Belliella filtrata]